MTSSDLRPLITDALRYWEPRRLLFNMALAIVVLVHFVVQLPGSKAALSPDLGLSFFIMAVLANLAYSAAYVPDLVMQFSGYRDVWLRKRWLLLLVGIAFAGAITSFFARAMFGGTL